MVTAGQCLKIASFELQYILLYENWCVCVTISPNNCTCMLIGLLI